MILVRVYEENMLTERIDLKPLIEAYLFANTPMYLFRHFRENASLRELTQQTSVEALTAEYIDRTRKEWKSIEDIVVAYATLIAITFLEYGQALTVFESLDLSHLDWGEEIKDIFQTTIDKEKLEQAIETATDFLTIDELIVLSRVRYGLDDITPTSLKAERSK